MRLGGPVMVASGCGGTGRELAPYADLDGLDFVTRSITLDPRAGGPAPRIAETPSGLVHAVGHQNPGLEHFLATELPWLVRAGARVHVSVVGSTIGEYAELARRLSRAPGVAGLEVNLGAPDQAGRGPVRGARALPRGQRRGRGPPRVPRRPAGARQAASRPLPRGRGGPGRPRRGRERRRARRRRPGRHARRAPRRADRSRDHARSRCAACTRSPPRCRTSRWSARGGVDGPRTARAFLAAGAVGRPGRHRTAARPDDGGADPRRPARPPGTTDQTERTHDDRPLRRPTARGDAAAWPLLRRHRPARRRCCATGGCPTTSPAWRPSRRTVVEAVAPEVSVVKPQSAFFERFGSRGVAVLERVIADSRAAGALVLLDVKRGDIGSTSQAYADAYLDPASPLASDAITASPYLGFGSLDPMVETARRHGAGVFVLALTSNKEGPEVQHATSAVGGTVAGTVLGHLRALNAGLHARSATSAPSSAPPSATAARTSTSTGPVLAPGFGAQGGTVDDLRRIFGPVARHVLPSSSREVLVRGARPDRPARRRPPGQRRRRRPRATHEAPGPAGRGAAALRRGSTAGCSSEQETYCQAVEEHQAELSDVAASEEPGAVLGALDAYRDLREQAPGDLGDEWSQVVTRLEALQQALDDAGVDPASYDPKTTPDGPPRRRPPGHRGGRPRPRDRPRPSRRWAASSSRPSTCARTPLSQ